MTQTLMFKTHNTQYGQKTVVTVAPPMTQAQAIILPALWDKHRALRHKIALGQALLQQAREGTEKRWTVAQLEAQLQTRFDEYNDVCHALIQAGAKLDEVTECFLCPMQNKPKPGAYQCCYGSPDEPKLSEAAE